MAKETYPSPAREGSYSVAQLSEDLGVSPRSVRNWIRQVDLPYTCALLRGARVRYVTEVQRQQLIAQQQANGGHGGGGRFTRPAGRGSYTIKKAGQVLGMSP
jgi:transposase-like protein